MAAATFAACVLLLNGCAKPNSVRVLRSPTSSVYLTFETYNGSGPVVADEMRLYAHYSQDGNDTKQLILDGEELELARLVWINPTTLVICLAGGTTDTFHNDVTLIIGTTDRKLHTYLREDCKPAQ